MWASLAAMTPLFDFAAALRAQERGLRLAGDRFLFVAAAEGMADRLSAVTRRFESGLWIAPAGESEPMNKPEIPEVLRPFASRWRLARFDAMDRLDCEAGEYD